MQIATAECRHGTFSYFANGSWVGKSLELYGEYSEDEVNMLQKVLRPGRTVINVGANLGALTVPMAQLVGPNGTVIAFEPQPETAELLQRNVAQNTLSQVKVIQAAAGAVAGKAFVNSLKRSIELGRSADGITVSPTGDVAVDVVTIDSLELKDLWFMLIDAEGSEKEVLQGAAKTIAKHRPIIYVENDKEGKSAELVAYLTSIGYRMWWHRPPLYNPKNFRGEANNEFTGVVSLMMLCAPEEMNIAITNLDEVSDLRYDKDIYNREIERYTRISDLHPTDLTARLMLAHYHNLMRHTAQARAHIAENLRRDPHHYPSQAINGLIRLQQRDWKAWSAFELRYKQRNTKIFGGDRDHGIATPWDGQPTDEPVLIWAEQGFGDSIMFARFIRNALRRAPNLMLEVQPQLFELFETSALVERGRLCRLGRSLPYYKYHCSIPSLANTLEVGGELSSLPYLKADAAMVKKWKDRPHPRIGVCWEGSPNSERPFTRDVPWDALEPIWRHRTLLSLNQAGQFESYADTAAAISDLDIVITVDSSVAHLAGALGAKTFLMLSFDPDWRWGLSGNRSIWYPTMRVFRQEELFDWSPVVKQIAQELEAYGDT